MTFKKIVFVSLSGIMAYFSYDIISDLIKSNDYDFGIGPSFFIAFLVNLYLLGTFAFIGFVLPTSKLIPASYYSIKNANQLKAVYGMLGVGYFRYLLLLFFWGTKKNRKKYFNGTRSGLKGFVYQSHQSEFGHLGGLILIIVASVIMMTKGFWWMASFSMVINIVGNLYPIILQRYHRIRIERLA